MYVFVIPGPVPGRIAQELVEVSSLIVYSTAPPEGEYRVIKDRNGADRELAGLNEAAEVVKAHVRRLPTVPLEGP